MKLARKVGKDEADEDDSDKPPTEVTLVGENDAALTLLQSGEADVLGGTAWLWARPEFAKAVDVLFIDEAGQMSLANALACTRAAGSLVLLGDPQQLDQPQKGTHPDGVGRVGARAHPRRTPDHAGGAGHVSCGRRGGLAAPSATSPRRSSMRASSRRGAASASSASGWRAGRFEGAGLFVLDVPHEGNRNGSDEEVGVVSALIAKLIAPGSSWIDRDGASHQVTPADILVVSPYNVQVSRLLDRLENDFAGAFPEVGTVDKFQGREAPVVIYSMATSRPEEAPRGLEFLFSLNRLNVATSRARCASVIVASPLLFEPDCKSPRQMQLANALCRYREMAVRLDL